MKTFDDLGMPFPLFRGPVAHACVDPAGDCKVCGKPAELRFFEACYECLRSGSVDHSMDSELGMVRVQDAESGLTYGLPLGIPQLGNYELVPWPVDPDFPDERWYHVRIDSEYLRELLRTPKYHTWQGAYWKFCCKRPCIFLGSLPAEAFPNSPKSTPEDIAKWFGSPDWGAIANGRFGSWTYYGFQCPVCGSFRYHEDVD
jgi:hypothetical protein